MEHEATWLLVGEAGAKNGEKRLRRLLTRTSQWANSETRQSTVRATAQPLPFSPWDSPLAPQSPPSKAPLMRLPRPAQANALEAAPRMDVLARVLRGEANCGDLRKARAPSLRRTTYD